MNDKEFQELKRQIYKKMGELVALQRLHRKETGRDYVVRWPETEPVFRMGNIAKTLAVGETQIMQRVKMLKTHAPKEIPNGSLGTVKCQCKIEESGLHYVEFDCGWAAYVYNHEVEKYNQPPEKPTTKSR